MVEVGWVAHDYSLYITTVCFLSSEDGIHPNCDLIKQLNRCFVENILTDATQAKLLDDK